MADDSKGLSAMETRILAYAAVSVLGFGQTAQVFKDPEVPAVVTVQLGHISDSLKEIKEDVKDGRTVINLLSQRVASVENLAQSALRISEETRGLIEKRQP